MWYLATLAVITAAIAAWFFFKKASPDGTLDVNKDGKVNADDAKAVADVNKDGKVTDADAKAAVIAVVKQAKVIAAEIEKSTPAPVVVEPPKAKRKAAAPKAPGAKKTTKKVKK